MTKRIFALLAINLLIVACTPAPAPTDSTGSSSSSSVSVSVSSVSSADDDEDEEDDEVEDDDDADVSISAGVDVKVKAPRVIAVSVDNFTFTPSVISLIKGEKVKIRLTGVAGDHGFSIPELGINTSVGAGQTIEVEIPTDKTGTFTFFCSIPCGPGHRDMKGTITIRE